MTDAELANHLRERMRIDDTQPAVKLLIAYDDGKPMRRVMAGGFTAFDLTALLAEFSRLREIEKAAREAILNGPPLPSELRQGQKLICNSIGEIVLYGGDTELKRWPAPRATRWGNWT